MKRLFLIACVLCIFMSCKNDIKDSNTITVNYPETKKVDTVDTYFGEAVNDPYRWLEDDRSAETEAWVKSQNVVTNDYLKNIPYRAELKERLSELWNYEKVGAPFVEGNYTYFRKNEIIEYFELCSYSGL